MLFKRKDDEILVNWVNEMIDSGLVDDDDLFDELYPFDLPLGTDEGAILEENARKEIALEEEKERKRIVKEEEIQKKKEESISFDPPDDGEGPYENNNNISIEQYNGEVDVCVRYGSINAPIQNVTINGTKSLRSALDWTFGKIQSTKTIISTPGSSNGGSNGASTQHDWKTSLMTESNTRIMIGVDSIMKEGDIPTRTMQRRRISDLDNPISYYLNLHTNTNYKCNGGSIIPVIHVLLVAKNNALPIPQKTTGGYFDFTGTGHKTPSTYQQNKENYLRNKKNMKFNEKIKKLKLNIPINKHGHKYNELSTRLGKRHGSNNRIIFTRTEIRARVCILQELNSLIYNILPLTDLTQCGWEDLKTSESNIERKLSSFSLGYVISSLRNVMFYRTKVESWTKSMLYTVANPPALMENSNSSNSINYSVDGSGGNDDEVADRPQIVIDRVAAAQLWHATSSTTRNDGERNEEKKISNGVNGVKKQENDEDVNDDDSTTNNNESKKIDLDATLFEQARSQLNNAACWQLRSLPPNNTTGFLAWLFPFVLDVIYR